MPSIGERTLRAVDRRKVLAGLTAIGLLPGARRIEPTGPLTAQDFDHVAIACSDLGRSRAFYEGLFGLQAAPGPDSGTLALPIGARRLLLTPASDGVQPGILRFCLRVTRLPEGAATALTAAGASVGPARGRHRGLIDLADPDGLGVRLVAGPAPPNPDASSLPVDNPLHPLSINHVTLTVADARRSLAFYRGVLGMWLQSDQGGLPVLGLGSRSGPEFPAIALGQTRQVPASINHVCFGVRDFDPAAVMVRLHAAGLTSVERSLPNAPLTATVRWRQANTNGGGPGAPLGTPELYFTDPDNTIIQLQDISYCGGSGPLGNRCSFGEG